MYAYTDEHSSNKPRREGFSLFLPCAERLLPIWDEIVELAESEDRQLEVIPCGRGAYALLGNPASGLEVLRLSDGSGQPEAIPLSIEQRALLFGAHRRCTSHVRHVMYLRSHVVVLSPSQELAKAVDEICSGQKASTSQQCEAGAGRPKQTPSGEKGREIMPRNAKTIRGIAMPVAVMLLLVFSVAVAARGEGGRDQTPPEAEIEQPSESNQQDAAEPEDQQPRRIRVPIFVPPLRGAPVGRIAGGSRGDADGAPRLLVLTPEYTAATAKSSPTLYWYTSEASRWPVELTIAEPRAVTPLLVRRLPAPGVAGLQRIDLQELDVSLEPDRVYRWYVALVRDEAKRSRDQLAFGEVQYRKPTTEFLARLEGATSGDLPYWYAGAGYWYEALDEVIRPVGTTRQLGGEEKALNRLLAQVGLNEVGSDIRSDAWASVGLELRMCYWAPLRPEEVCK